MASEGPVNGEAEIRERHKRRVEEMRREKEKQMMRRRQIKKFAPPVIGAAAALVLFGAGASLFHNFTGDEKNKANNANDKIIEGAYIDDTKEKSVSANSTDDGSDKEDTAGENKQFVSAKRKINIFDNERMGTGSGPKEGYAAERLLESAGKRKYKANENGDILQIGDALRSGDEFYSKNAILIDLDSNNIVAWKGAKERISPASMTKILTLLVAAEHVENLDDTFTITLDITDYSYRNQCSNAGFAKEEEVTVRDLLYGTILPSGADAAMGLAMYVAGSHEAFVEMMNEKLEELGLSETAHFTNCVGIYDENHYCTVYDMAMIIEAAADNALCREVLTAHTYVTSKTEQHPEGLELSNWFLRRIEDHLEGGETLYAKTGYVDQSGNCAASYALSDTGKRYVCVTVGADSYWRCIFDHAGLYGQFFAS